VFNHSTIFSLEKHHEGHEEHEGGMKEKKGEKINK
jgi:hypothetical protein